MSNLNYLYVNSFKLNDDLYTLPMHCYYNETSAFLLSEKGISLIVDKKYLDQIIDKNICEALRYKLIMKGFTNNFKRYDVREEKIMPKFFMIDFSTKCNLDCFYCLRDFRKKGTTIENKELVPILDYIIKYANDNKLKHLSLQPWGGEPLLAKEQILFMDDYFKKNDLSVAITIQTNGTLLDEELLKEFSSRKITFGVSIDGCKEIHDKHRKDLGQRGSFDRIVRNMDLLKKYYKNFGIISVNSKYSLPYIRKSLNNFVDLGIRCVKFNLVHPNNNEFDKELVVSDEEIPLFIETLMDEIININKAGKKIFDANVRDKVLNLVKGGCNQLCHSDGCTGGYTFVTFARNGDIYPCELVGNESLKIGNINDGNLSEIITNSVSTNRYFKKKEDEKCHLCPWKVYCNGGCTASILSYGDKSGIDEKECVINRYLYPRLIDKILNNREDIYYLTNGEVEIN